ncbi:MAG TPA: methylated-DNA--[protein]-cysteine S-methyltransferase [Thermoanaerobaculia bacterium]|nr:methylated-DNA--[protein]-cysteine S-methyltransferase [Thermoanaerobaculia bacterium]
MRCKTVLTRIDALRTGELEPVEKSEVEQHLGTCRSCEDSAHDLTALASLTRELSLPPARSCAESVCGAVRASFAVLELDGRRIFVVFSGRGIRTITTGDWTPEEFRARHASRFGTELEQTELPEELRDPIVRVLRGEEAGRCEVDLSELTEFEKAVLETIRRIPKGEVRPYGWVAEQVGRPKAVRAVGNVMARNPVPLILPCHRVVPNAGGLGNYGWGPSMKRTLLQAEGVPVEELDALASKGLRYVGSKTTGIFCFPTCRDARRIRPDNRVLFHDAAEAAEGGFRPCKRCLPASRASRASRAS